MFDDLKKSVSEYYGKTVQKTSDLEYDACCTSDYDPALTKKLTEEVLSRRYGCGSPIPEALQGRIVVDLGCGAGADAYMASQLVGPSGKVIGVDMTAEQLEIAKRNIEPHMDAFGFDEPNVEFVEGFIEKIPLEDSVADVVISNCVINLSNDKQAVFNEIWCVLKPGGEFYIADIVADRRVPTHLQEDGLLWSECLTGALYIEDFRRNALEAGFEDIRTLSSRRLSDVIEGVHFYSRIIRGFKLPLDDRCEDFGQLAIYKGTIDRAPKRYTLDLNHVFKAGEATRVCKNTADMLKGSRLSEHFVVSEPLHHLGLFDCGPTAEIADEAPATSSCC